MYRLFNPLRVDIADPDAIEEPWSGQAIERWRRARIASQKRARKFLWIGLAAGVVLCLFGCGALYAWIAFFGR